MSVKGQMYGTLNRVYRVDRQIGQINSGAFWVFSAKLSAPILVQ